jgi:hypothetical protein
VTDQPVPTDANELAALIYATELRDAEIADETGEYGDTFDELYDRFVDQEGQEHGHALWMAAMEVIGAPRLAANRRGLLSMRLTDALRETAGADHWLTELNGDPELAALLAEATRALTAARNIVAAQR